LPAPRRSLLWGKFLAVGEWEDAEWRYITTFSLLSNEFDGDPELVSHGVDWAAEYFVNGRLLGASSNSLVEHRVQT
jgi:hypothetical protein